MNKWMNIKKCTRKIHPLFADSSMDECVFIHGWPIKIVYRGGGIGGGIGGGLVYVLYGI